MDNKNRFQIKRNIFFDKGDEDDIYLGDIDNIKDVKDSEEYLTNLKKTNKQQFFKQYCQLYIELSKKGAITRQTAAYIIAGSMFNKELREISEIQKIVMLAGRLELPYRHATDNGDKQTYDKEWNSLVEKIHSLEY